MLYEFFDYATELAFFIGQIILILILLELLKETRTKFEVHEKTHKPLNHPKKSNDIKASKEQLKYQTLLKNIDIYDGTSRGQEDLDG